MGAQQSKDELLYQQVSYGNVEGIRRLRSEGAGLEYKDKDGKTPLIAACLRPDLLNVAQALIELGADVNAFRPGAYCGTPLHHAAKKGLELTVHLLMSSGANPFVINDDCRTALDLARDKGHPKVVRAIEGRIALFCGWLRECYAPSLLDAVAPQLLTRKIWAVIVPRDARNPTNPVKFQLAIYSDLQVGKPRSVIAMWKCQIEEPKYNVADPSIIIVDKTTKVRHKFFPAYHGDKQQLQWFYDACRGHSQVNASVSALPSPFPMPSQPPGVFRQPAGVLELPMPDPFPGTTSQEDIELAMAINASIQSTIAEGIPSARPAAQRGSFNCWDDSAESSRYNGWDSTGKAPAANVVWQNDLRGRSVQTSQEIWMSSLPAAPPAAAVLPSAPPVMVEIMEEIPPQHSSIDSSPVSLPMPSSSHPVASSSAIAQDPRANGGGDTSSSCIICYDAPVEGACVPCGHMAGCMQCLTEIEEKKMGCPVCRVKISQVIKLYAV